MRSAHVLYRLPHRVHTGSWHMDADRALLDWVSEDPSRLVFRTYGWDRPTLSLGRTNPYPEGWDEKALALGGIAVVRRPTGGGAVLHWDDEVSFALAASIPGPWDLTPRGFADAAAEALSGALRACGVAGSRVAGSPSAGASGPGAALCFARSAPGEVEAAGFKVAGLASRFRRTGALCHASVPLSARSRAITRFRAAGQGEAEALERHTRSLGELLGSGSVGEGSAEPESLAAEIADRLAVQIAARFGAPLLDATFAALGIEEERVSAQPSTRAAAPAAAP